MSMDDSSPALEVGFIIDTAGSFGELLQLQAAMDSTEAKVLADATKIERATRGMVDVSGGTSNIVAFGNAASRELHTARMAMANVEKAGERMVAQLERQNSTFGKTREEIRAMNAEFRATAAEQKGLTELAQRIRAEEAALFDKEFAAARRATQAAEAAAEAKFDAANKAARAAEMEAQAIREADHAYQLFESHRRQGLAAWKEVEAAQARAAAEAAVNAQLLEQSRLQAALDRTSGADRPRATDAGASFSALSAKFAEDEARAARTAAAEVKQLANEHERLAAMVRGSHDAQVADAAAAEQLRLATDPLYAATKRLNAEIAESTRLYHSGATAPAEYARQQDVLSGRLRQVGQAHDEMGGAMRKSGGALKNIAVQLPDITQGLLTGQKPMQVLIQQGAQIFQVAQMAEGGLKGFAAEVGGLAVAFLPAIAVASVAGVALYRWKQQIDDDAGMKKFADGLGLTHKEMKKLGDVSVTTGDMVAGVWKTISDGMNAGGSGKSIMDYLFSPNDAQQVQGFLASIYGTFTGTYAAIVELWSSISTSVSAYVSAAAAAVAQFFAPVVAAAQWAGNWISEIFSSIYNRVSGWLKSIGSAISDYAGPILKAMGQSDTATAVTNAGSNLGKAFGKGYAQGAGQVINGTNAFVSKAAENIIDKAHERLTKKANEIKADRTPKKTPVDRHAESLVRDAEAVEAQIRNLYALAKAYGVSDAAALIAEARVKAESKAIKQQADIEASVDRQVRLAIAQRVSDAAKSTAGARNQAAAQMIVNAQVAAGLVPAERAADLVKDQISDLPLLAAIEAARTRGLTTEAARATQALADQRAARDALTVSERAAQFNSETATGNDRLAELREEQRLIGATDMERVRALATLKAMQEAQKFNPADRDAYVKQQVEIAVGQQALTEQQDAYNASLTATADLFDTIDQSAQRAAQGMSEAFGSVGTAIGDTLTVMTGYYADQAKLQEAHAAAIRDAHGDQKRIDRENEMFAIRSSSAQIGAFGDMASAAKGFFKKGSDGYKAMATAEKAFRLVQFALSVRAIAQDAIETGTKIANSVARIAVGATEAVVNAIKSLPFPLNLAAGAATVAALASIGVSIAGSFGGGGKNTLAPTNSGTGTVLGDSSAKSDSIKNAIDALKEVDTVTNTFAREMAASLKSIDSQIGGVASLVARAGNIDASTGVNEGFKANAIGSVLSKIPVIGGILGGLFGSKTSVIGTGLSSGPQSVGNILGNGFDASYYSDIQKKKKLFGLTTSTK
ncbi:tail length tape measure protein, partial [Sphingomonas sp. PP-CE-1G-424]